MKKLALRKSLAPAAACAGLCLAGGVLDSQAQTQLTPGQKKLLLNEVNGFLGGRAEVGIVLGASDSASGGNYTVDGRRGGDDLDYSLSKFSGGGQIGEPRKLGDTDFTWNPVVMGSISSFYGKNDVSVGLFRGNKLEESTSALEVGGGVALHLGERWTVTPTIGMVYGHYDPHIIAHTQNGFALKRSIDGSADALGVTPGVGVAYKLPIGKNTLEFSAHYTFYGTSDISDSDYDIGGASHVFEQRADADVPLPAELWNCQLHTGGYLSLTEVAGDLGDTMSSDVWATIHGRLLLDTLGKSWAWKMDRVGIGMSGIFANHFSGWDAGVEVSFKF